MTARIYAYKRGPSRPKVARQTPEADFQIAVVKYLTYALPPDCLFTASAAGARMGMKTASRMKAMGQRPGWPDLQILPADGVTRFIELKADGGSTSAPQRAFRTHCLKAEIETRRYIWAIAKTLEDVEAALIRFGIKPRCSISQANRYHIGEWHGEP